MVGQVRPRPGAQHLRLMRAGVAEVDAIQRQQRPPRRESRGQAPIGKLEGFLQAAAREQGMPTLPPIVEITSHDQGRVGWDVVVDDRAQQLQLLAAMRLAQAQVCADGMHVLYAPGISTTQ